MSQIHKSFKTLFAPEIQKEINILPQELIKKKREIEDVKKEILNNGEKYKTIENQLKLTNNDIIIEEKNLTDLLSKKYYIKTRQKGLIKSINKELFLHLIKILMNDDNKYFKEILLLFFNFKEDYKDELTFIIQNKESFIELMKNSYKNIKILYKENINKYNNIKVSIINIMNDNGYINIDTIKYPFNIIIKYIINCFEIINIKNKIKEINDILKKKNITKNNIFLNKLLLQNEIEEKEQKLVNLNKYCKIINNIIEKYKALNNIETEKEIINMLGELHKNSISYFKKNDSKIDIKEKNKVKIKEKKLSNIKIINDKENVKSKKIFFSQAVKIKDKLNLNNKINTISNINQNQNPKLKELSCIEIFKPHQLNKNIQNRSIPRIRVNTYSFITNIKNVTSIPRIKVNTYSFVNNIKNVTGISKNNPEVNPKRKTKYIVNKEIKVNISTGKKQINKIFFPYSYSRIVPINNKLNRNKKMISSYNNLLIKKKHKNQRCDVSLNKSMGIFDDKFLKTEQGSNKYITTNYDTSRERYNICYKKVFKI